MVCKNCGQYLPDGSVFCNKCGERTEILDFTSKKAVRRGTIKNILKLVLVWGVSIAVILWCYFNFSAGGIAKNNVEKYLSAVKSGGDYEAYKFDSKDFVDFKYIESYSDLSSFENHKMKAVAVLDEEWFKNGKKDGSTSKWDSLEDAIKETKEAYARDENENMAQGMQVVEETANKLVYTTGVEYTQYIIGATVNGQDENGKDVKQRISFIMTNYDEKQGQTIEDYRIQEIVYERPEDLDEEYFKDIRY